LGKLLKNPKVAVALVAVLAVGLVSLAGGALGTAVGGGFLSSPIPHIQLAAERAVKIGGYDLANTTIMFWFAGVVLLLLVWLATRRMREVPGRLQGLFEAIVEFFDNTADSVAGGARAGRRYLPVMLGIFLILLFSNWMGILPGLGTIGWVESPEEWVEHRVEARLEQIEEHPEAETKLVGDACLMPDVEDAHERALLEVVCEHAEEKFAVFDGDGALIIPPGRGEDTKVTLAQVIGEDTHDAHEIEERLHEGRVHDLTAEQQEDFPGLTGKKAGVLVPYLRGASTDLNTTLSVALFAMVTVQLWGIKALGGGTYASKFFPNPLKKGPILLAVGLLEAFGEFARTISFTFRLFGNMFAGEVLLIAMGFLLPLIGMLPFMGLEVFVGLIQAFVFAMLTLVFGVTASAHHGEEHEEHPAPGHGDAVEAGATAGHPAGATAGAH
jgi:F-type H+-transporting ATPase subunit a